MYLVYYTIFLLKYKSLENFNSFSIFFHTNNDALEPWGLFFIDNATPQMEQGYMDFSVSYLDPRATRTLRRKLYTLYYWANYNKTTRRNDIKYSINNGN